MKAVWATASTPRPEEANVSHTDSRMTADAREGEQPVVAAAAGTIQMVVSPFRCR